MSPTKRQLTMPFLPRLSGSRARPDKRARRDFTPAEFARALARNGIRQMAGGLVFADDETGRVISAAYRTNPIRVARRATLAKILRARGGVDGH